MKAKTNGRTARTAKATSAKRARGGDGRVARGNGETYFPVRHVPRNEPRSVPDCRAGDELRTSARRVPERPLDGFIIHDPDSFDPDSFDPGKLWTPQISDAQWKAAGMLLEQGYVLGVCAHQEEATILAGCVSSRFPYKLLVAYDGDEEMFWVTRA